MAVIEHWQYELPVLLLAQHIGSDKAIIFVLQ